MPRKPTILFFASLYLSLSLLAQNRPTPLFKKIQFAGYEVTADGKQKLYFYSEIDASGIFKIQMNYLREPKTVSVKLADSTIQKLNTVISGNKKLDQYIIPKETEHGVHYTASSYRFIQYTSLNNQTDALSFIRFILDDTLRELIIELENILDQEDLPEIKTPLKPDQKFINALSRDYQKSEQLPKLKPAPPEM